MEHVVAGAATGAFTYIDEALPIGVVVTLDSRRGPRRILGRPHNEQGSVGVMPNDVMVTVLQRMPRPAAGEPPVLPVGRRCDVEGDDIDPHLFQHIGPIACARSELDNSPG